MESIVITESTTKSSPTLVSCHASCAPCIPTNRETKERHKRDKKKDQNGIWVAAEESPPHQQQNLARCRTRIKTDSLNRMLSLYVTCSLLCTKRKIFRRLSRIFVALVADFRKQKRLNFYFAVKSSGWTGAIRAVPIGPRWLLGNPLKTCAAVHCSGNFEEKNKNEYFSRSALVQTRPSQ